MTPMKRSQWVFETRYLGSEWITSGIKEDTAYDAAKNAADWLIVSAENGILAEVRLKELRPVD